MVWRCLMLEKHEHVIRCGTEWHTSQGYLYCPHCALDRITLRLVAFRFSFNRFAAMLEPKNRS